jgi:hypothetical protein
LPKRRVIDSSQQFYIVISSCSRLMARCRSTLASVSETHSKYLLHDPLYARGGRDIEVFWLGECAEHKGAPHSDEHNLRLLWRVVGEPGSRSRAPAAWWSSLRAHLKGPLFRLCVFFFRYESLTRITILHTIPTTDEIRLQYFICGRSGGMMGVAVKESKATTSQPLNPVISGNCRTKR